MTETAAATASLGEAVAVSKAWLDRSNGTDDHEITLRILKVLEEAGEVAAARIGNLGQNPRKGMTHTSQDIADELADVIITSAVAIESLGLSAETVLGEKCRYIIDRIGQSS